MKMMKIVMVGLVDILSACLSHENKCDATGPLEATGVVVSAEQNGRLPQLGTVEGSEISRGQQTGLIDAVQSTLKVRQVGADSKSTVNQKPDVNAQTVVLRQQFKQTGQERQRFEGLVNDGAANRKQLDNVTSAVWVSKRQLAAQQSSLNSSTHTLNSQTSTDDVRKYQVPDQLKKRHVTSPLTGTVLEKYAEEGELAPIGKPLFRAADTKNLSLCAYLAGWQLEKARIRQRVTVFSDYGDDISKEYKGKVVWILPRLEFTPKTILTDDERADQVYAVKTAVQNDGHIKIGMHGGMEL